MGKTDEADAQDKRGANTARRSHMARRLATVECKHHVGLLNVIYLTVPVSSIIKSNYITHQCINTNNKQKYAKNGVTPVNFITTLRSLLHLLYNYVNIAFIYHACFNLNVGVQF